MSLLRVSIYFIMNSSLQEKHTIKHFIKMSLFFLINLHRYDTIIVYVNLIEDFINDFKTNLIVYYILQKSKQKLTFLDKHMK